MASTRTFFDFDTVRAALESIVSMFEKRLKELNPTLPTISYDIADLYAYLDTFHDFTALVLDPSCGKYDPFPKEWVKEQVFNLLKQQALAKGRK